MSIDKPAAAVAEPPPTPIGYEDAEYWLFVSSTGLKESFRIRPTIGEKVELQKSPLDGSLLAAVVTFKAGDSENAVTGRRFFPLGNAGCTFHFDVAFHKDAIFASGDSPAEREMKKRELGKANAIERREALLNQRLDDLDD